MKTAVATPPKERFLREAQFLAQFEHDNVLRVYSVDAERGWIVMELMKGTLASIIAAGPSDPTSSEAFSSKHSSVRSCTKRTKSTAPYGQRTC